MLAMSDIIKSLNVTAVSMIVVFITLFCISMILQGFKVVFKERKNKGNISLVENKTNQKKDGNDIDIKDNQVLAAIFTAAIASSERDKMSNIRIKSIKKVS